MFTLFERKVVKIVIIKDLLLCLKGRVIEGKAETEGIFHLLICFYCHGQIGARLNTELPLVSTGAQVLLTSSPAVPGT